MNLTDDQEVEMLKLLGSLADICERHGDQSTMGRARRLARDITDDRALRGVHGMGPPPPQSPPMGFQAPAPIPPPEHRPAVISLPASRIRPEKTKDGSTILHVAPGIGDNAWLAMKLPGLVKRWGGRIVIKPAEDHPRRTEEFIRLLPGVEFGGYSHMDGRTILEYAHANPYSNADQYRGMELPFTCNHHIELGRRIEDFLPEVPTSYLLKLERGAAAFSQAEDICDDPKERLLFAIYASDDGPVNNYRFWSEKGWSQICLGIQDSIRMHVRFITIGASFDIDLQSRLRAEFKRAKLELRECLGEPFGVAAEVLKLSDLLLAFPSGIPIVHTLQGGSTIWWLPRDQPNVPGGGNVRNCTGWIPPQALAEGRIETRLIETPEMALEGILASRPFRALAEKVAAQKAKGGRKR